MPEKRSILTARRIARKIAKDKAAKKEAARTSWLDALRALFTRKKPAHA